MYMFYVHENDRDDSEDDDGIEANATNRKMTKMLNNIQLYYDFTTQ